MSQTLQLIIRILWAGEFYQLNFLKLVLANNTAYVFSIGACLAAKTGGVSGEGDRKSRRIKHLVAIQIRHRYLGRWHQPQFSFPMRHPERISGKLGKLA